jgi:energy-converting hydrogenase Eha subunit F
VLQPSVRLGIALLLQLLLCLAWLEERLIYFPSPWLFRKANAPHQPIQRATVGLASPGNAMKMLPQKGLLAAESWVVAQIARCCRSGRQEAADDWEFSGVSGMVVGVGSAVRHLFAWV